MERFELIRRAMRVLAPTASYIQRDEEIEWFSQDQQQPSIAALEAEIQRQQTLLYKDERAAQYPTITDQLDMLWHAIDSGSLDKDSDFYKSLKAVKDANPKG